MMVPDTAALCEAKSWGPGNFQWPCEMKAKWLVEMEGRPPIKVCGRHVRTYKGDIAVGIRGTITSLRDVQHNDG